MCLFTVNVNKIYCKFATIYLNKFVNSITYFFSVLTLWECYFWMFSEHSQTSINNTVFSTAYTFQNVTHKMQNTSMQNEALHSKYHKHISKANICKHLFIILVPYRFVCYIDNCVLCFTKSVLWNWKLIQNQKNQNELYCQVYLQIPGICFRDRIYHNATE